jgi:hypothetical protein
MKLSLKGITSGFWMSQTQPSLQLMTQNNCSVWYMTSASTFNSSHFNFFAVKQVDLQPYDQIDLDFIAGRRSDNHGGFNDTVLTQCNTLLPLTRCSVWEIDLVTGTLGVEYVLIGHSDYDQSLMLKLAFPSASL